MASEKIVRSACAHDCSGLCILNAHVQDGRIVRISSDTSRSEAFWERPLRACARGRSYRQRVYHPDRLLHPLIRVGERGEGQFRQATWDEALDVTAAAIRRARDRYGPEALYVHAGSGHKGLLRGNNLAMRLLGLYGGFLGYYGTYSVACVERASLSAYGTVETGSSWDDLASSRLVILWSSNAVDTQTGCGAPQGLLRAKRAGARVVVVDPIYTDTAASFADEWIPIYPGTDTALMAALAHVILEEGLVDRAFLDACCVGHDEAHLPAGAEPGASYEAYVRGVADGIPKTPGWAAAITGVPTETIVRLAREYATAKPAALIEGRGMQRAAYGEQPARGCIALAALTGNVGIHGGSAAGQYALGRRMRLAQIPAPNPVTAKIPIYRWLDAITNAADFTPAGGLVGAERLMTNVKLILNIQGNALVNQHSDLNRTATILRDPSMVEFILVADTFLTSSGRFADVVVPASTWFEREDIVAGGDAGDFALFLNKAVEPLGESRSDYWALSRLAERLGVGEAFTEGRDEDAWLRHLAAQSGIPDYARLKETGIYRRAWTEPHVAFADFRGAPGAHPLATPSGKIEIYSSEAAAVGDPVGVPAVPRYAPSWEGREDPLRARFPLQLLTPHPKHRTHSIHGNLPWILEIDPGEVLLAASDAADRGIAAGDRVRVFNDRGALVLRARPTERVMPGVVVASQGRWHRPRSDGADEGGNANVLTSQRPSPWARGSTTHTTLVEVARETTEAGR